MKAIQTTVVLVVLAALGGCVTSYRSGSNYTPRQTMNEMSVRMATVESVREVNINMGEQGVGTLTGAALGGIAGSNIGGGKGSAAAAIAGAVAGGILGQQIEHNASQRKGYEITVRLENGELRAITQEADEQFRPGERVRLLSDGRTTRITH